jgi:hypothetical protein
MSLGVVMSGHQLPKQGYSLINILEMLVVQRVAQHHDPPIPGLGQRSYVSSVVVLDEPGKHPIYVIDIAGHQNVAVHTSL